MATSGIAPSSPLSPVISNAPVVVEWSDIASRPRTPRYLADPNPSSVQLNLLFNEEEDAVSFKIRVRLHFEQASSGDRKEYVYICIHPENVRLLLHCPTYRLPKGFATAVRGPTASFRLVLNKPVSILTPLDTPVPLRSKGSPQLLDSLEELSRQTILSIHLGQHTISDLHMVRRICDAFTNGSIKQHPRHDSLRDFYRGHGARVAQFAGFPRHPGEGMGMRNEDEVEGVGSHGASPPPYPEPQQLPPASLFAQQNKRQRSPEHTPTPSKRPRLYSESSGTIEYSWSNACAELLGQQKAQMTELFSWQQAEMAKLIEQQLAVLARMDRAVQGMETRIIARVEEHFRAMLGKADDEESKSEEWGRLIRNLVDESIVNLESALESSLEREKEELIRELKDECLNDLKDVLEDGLVSIRIPR